MTNTWQSSFAQLKEFVKENPSIEIAENSISIPSDVRPEFYRRFDKVRVDFLKDNYVSSLEKGYELSKEFARTYKKTIAASELDAISIRAAVNWFLQDPVDGLMRSLFDPVFNLIRGRLSEQSFSEHSIQLIDSTFSEYFREGYERWAVLGLLINLQPGTNYCVPSRDFHTDTDVTGGSIHPGLRDDLVESAEESKKISFESSSITNFIVPRILFNSRRLKRHVAIHTDHAEAWWGARSKSERVEWLNIKSLIQEYGRARLWPDLLFYTGDDLNDLNLVADYAWVARPDLIVEVEETEGWYERGGLDIARRHIAILKPRLGCYIISRTEPPAEAYNEIMPKPPVAVTDQISEQKTPAENTGDNMSSPMPQTGDEQLSAPTPEPEIRIIHANYDFDKLGAIIETLQAGKPA